MTTRELQARLIALGYDLGPSGADGDFGRLTAAAVQMFQQSKGLPGTGQVDAVTQQLLTAGTGAVSGGVPVLPWLEEARRNIGLRETKGPAHTPAIICMLEALKAPFRNDEDAWCGTFVGWCIAKTLPTEAVPANPWGSINWMRFGRPLGTPMFGCVGVFWRGSPDGWQGHVAFIIGQDAESFHILGGNQNDAVNVTRIAKGRLRKTRPDGSSGLRWPSTFLDPVVPVPNGSLAGTLSQNEA